MSDNAAPGWHVYPVGLWMDWRYGTMRRGVRYLFRQARAKNWRAVRNYFNGYLAEHDGHAHNAGRGWTRRAAIRRGYLLCDHAVEAALRGEGG